MTKETITKYSSTNTNSKKEQMKKKQQMEKKQMEKKRSGDSDHDGEDDDDIYSDNSFSDTELDDAEYQKLLYKLFPSKYTKEKVLATQGLKKAFNSKKVHKEDDSNLEDIWETDESESDNDSNNDSNNDSDNDLNNDLNNDSDNDFYNDLNNESNKKSNKSKKQKNIKEKISDKVSNKDKNQKKKENQISKTNKEKVSDKDKDQKNKDKVSDKDKNQKKKENVNIIFTIGGTESDEDWSEYDSDYESGSNVDTENEDESVSSVSEDDEEDDEEDGDVDDGEDVKGCKSKDNTKTLEKGTKKDISTKLITTITNHLQHVNEELMKEDTYVKLKDLVELDPTNKSLKKSLSAYESNFKKQLANKEKKEKKQKAKHVRIFKKIIKDKNTMNDNKFFEELETDRQKKLIKELREINKTTRIEKPYRISLLECDMPTQFKGVALKKINSLRYMEPGSGEYNKIKNWVDTFMRIPFGKYKHLPVSLNDDGVEKCHEFMENAQKTLNEAVYGLNDAKMQIMQMLGQLITNPQAIGSAIAIHGPPGTGKTSLVKEGISKILNRPFAFIALGGATDSSFLEGHSYTYEGSTWGKIVQILVDSNCMNPVIYFDELDKLSETPRGDEIAGILTHLTDSSQNNQFHDKYYSEVDFDLSKCLFIFSYNDETKVNAILKDRMYRIQTKGYEQKQKIQIANNYLIKKIREQVKFGDSDIIIDDQVLGYIIEKFCNKEDGVRNLKRCLEIIHTKLNLYRLMKPGTNLFEENMSLTIEFPLNITRQIVDKLIKTDINGIPPVYLGMYM